ncbi:chemosensory receptor c [Plakobranchus ocellatus]|uniref:Chemosensory receptor c n=1 Tax=Plakobranchus ocellatus TaxID=259542 RepID=A0AAV4A9A1_9GAST|nr:chemosensory receptor c [Plakobranchus ocellatus]
MQVAMNISVQVEIQDALKRQIMSDELYSYFNLILCILIAMVSLAAVFVNAINIVIFWKIGVSDSITVCLFYLAVCDFCSTLLVTLCASLMLFYALNVPGSMNFPTYTFIATIAYALPLDIAATTTAYIAVQRGLCVAWPFLTRHAFTKNRSTIVLFIISLLMFGFWLPRAVTFRLVQVPGPTVNSSAMLTVDFLEIWTLFDRIYLISLKLILGYVQYIVMLLCAVAIAIGMKSSIRLKSTSSSSAPVSSSNRSGHEKPEIIEQSIASSNGNKEKIGIADSGTGSKAEKDKKSQQKGVKELQDYQAIQSLKLENFLCEALASSTIDFRFDAHWSDVKHKRILSFLLSKE